MNFLAHIYLSGESEEIMLGNFIADAIRGKEYQTFPEQIQTGVLLHRQIDCFTDTHPVFNQSRARLRKEYGKYAGVVGDIFYDHFLAVEWNNYHKQPLAEFAENTYRLIQNRIDILPGKVQEFFPYMVRGNWLFNYSRIEGIKRTLEGMSRRTKFSTNLYTAIDELRRDYSLYQEEFRNFFPEVQKFTLDYLSRNLEK
jgi:acyl carrier protein phosphodiesterase